MTKALTKVQQEVLALLKDGWELGVSGSVFGTGRIWVQKGGIGKGGQSEKVRKTTFDALVAGGHIIKTSEHFPTIMYGAAGE